jgi:hypothetical protein
MTSSRRPRNLKNMVVSTTLSNSGGSLKDMLRPQMSLRQIYTLDTESSSSTVTGRSYNIWETSAKQKGLGKRKIVILYMHNILNVVK